MPRGGKRNGTPGASYANRTDLNGAPSSPLPPTAAPGQPYGAAGAQLAGQAAVPMAPPSPAAGPPPGAAPPTAPAGPPPAHMGPFNRPTERPGEPVTAGLPVGAGPGPAAVPGLASGPGDFRSLLASAASSSVEVRYLSDVANGGRG